LTVRGLEEGVGTKDLPGGTPGRMTGVQVTYMRYCANSAGACVRHTGAGTGASRRAGTGIDIE
jgi:hypothetical protein